MNAVANQLSQIFRTSFQAYGVLAFSPHPLPAALILFASFYHPVVGLMGLAGNLVSTLMARWMHANKDAWQAGIFGVSGILIGLALGKYAEPSVRIWIFLIVGSGISAVISVALAHYFAKYDLPILSLPFMAVIWLLLLSSNIVDGSVDHQLSIGFLKSIDLWLFDIFPLELFEYLKMFGSIIFQNNLLSGVLVMIAIGLYSRISLLFGLWGGLLGMFTYAFLHSSLDGFHGLNYVLISLALGGFFVIANRHAFFFVSLAVITTGLVDIAMSTLLVSSHLPPLVFAFNVVTLLFLFPLKMRPESIAALRLVPVPLYLIKSPETNLRWYRRWSRQKSKQKTILTFPFLGEWSILQGNDGEWTHKGVGKYAWDFVVRDVRNHQSKGFGTELTDYYAWGLPVLAPAPGIIYSLENTVVDNPLQIVDTERNWGNYVIIDHENGEFSELSHFMQGSIVVLPGQRVGRGEILGRCGNSGRSPVPHIHYQLQTAPEVGTPTLPCQFGEGLVNGDIRIDANPKKDDKVSALTIDGGKSWSMLGRELESWTFHCHNRWRTFSETLNFSTDVYGLPALVSKNNLLWRITELPNFIVIRPDFKTFPSLLTASVWIHIVGDQLILPKRLKEGLSWEGNMLTHNDKLWCLSTEKQAIYISDDGTISEVRIIDQPKFQFSLKKRDITKK